MLRVVFPPIVRSTHNCIYSIWYLSNRYRYLPLWWKSWNWSECGVGIVLICFGSIKFPHHNQTSSNSSTIAAGSSNGLTSTRYCKCSCVCSWWWVEIPPETCRAVFQKKNKLCNVASYSKYIKRKKSTMCFGCHCAILREQSYRFSKSSAYLELSTVVELESTKYITYGFFTEIFTIIKTVFARCYGLKFLKNIKIPRLEHVDTCWWTAYIMMWD